jgi:phosphoribosylanthranilate isomerase
LTTLLVKICGLSTPKTMRAALEAGADMVGLVFHPKSPRYIAPDAAAALSDLARGRATVTALLVDADDALLDTIMRDVRPDLLQLHGRETPERVREIKRRTGRPVMKALGISGPADLGQIAAYRDVADRLLLDAKPPKGAAYPGGHGKPFDWGVLDGLDPATPFLLSGGLTPENVAEAIDRVRQGGARLEGVDVSSGVESAPGIKDEAAIRAFIAAVRSIERL